MPTESVDAVILGTGQAAKPLATALADAGQRVVVVEREHVGGSCINYGCTPTKTLIASGRVAHVVRRAADYGVHVENVHVDMERVRQRKRDIVSQFRSGGEKTLDQADGVELIRGHGRLTGPKTVTVDLNDGGTRTWTAERIFLNTGTRPRWPDVPGLDAVDALDNKTVMELGEVPSHLIVLGGGYIGCELSQLFRRLGAEVTVVQDQDVLLGREDDDVAEALREIFEDDGITVLVDARATGVRRTDDGLQVEVRTGDGEPRTLTGSHLLVAAGRVPNSDDLGLEAGGVRTDDHGFVPTDDRCRTNVDGIFALGDLRGGPAFTHIAYDDYRIVADLVLGDGRRTTDDRPVPYTLFTDPQLGRVGLTETEARRLVADRGRRLGVARQPMTHVARALETDETAGFMKAVVDLDTDQILGVAILGMQGGEVMSLLQVAMMGQLPYTAIRDGVFAHPTLAESLNNLFSDVEAL